MHNLKTPLLSSFHLTIELSLVPRRLVINMSNKGNTSIRASRGMSLVLKGSVRLIIVAILAIASPLLGIVAYTA
ncbi:hypothetical protein, partial [Staphylococcus aureus]|uniref:hypothetical protein n=1 Tax=Staphylococcus aureus TaxID=1280 RepID=UPI001E547D81